MRAHSKGVQGKLFVSRKLKSQGDLDGACFLYSIANAVISLDDAVDAENWSHAISSLRLRECRSFFCQDVGTLDFDDNIRELEEKIAKPFLKSLSGKKFAITVTPGERQDLKDLIDENAVAIVGNREHWFVVTEVHEGTVFVACSYTFNDDGCKYHEEASPKFGHISNLRMKFSELHVFGGMIFRIERI